jgi:hypothetical protein
MNNLSELISNIDFLLLIFMAVLAFLFMRTVLFRNMDKRFYILLAVVFGLKITGTLINNLLIIYYWKTGDAISYYNEAKNLCKLMLNNPQNIRYLFSPVEQYDALIKSDNVLTATTSGAGLESNFLVTRFCTVLFPFSFGRFILLNFWFCLIATVAQFRLYLVLQRRYPHIKKYLGISLLYMPTLLFYASPIFKETLCLAFIAFSIHQLYQISQKNNMIANSLLLLANIALIYLLKPYVLYSLLISFVIVWLFKAMFHFYGRSFIGGSLTIGVFIVLIGVFIYYMNYFDPYIASFADLSNFFQQQYNDTLDDSSSFELGELETSMSGVIKKSPLAIYTTYFRPHIWEVRKPIVLFSALESFFILFMIIFAFAKKGIHTRQMLKADFPATIMIVYVLVFGIIVGLTTFNFGTLVRYKVPAVPFLWVFVFLLLLYKPQAARA